ncbi:MAG: two-component system, OmpR family, response regulator RegX3 [Actinomycetota bacterium]|nr:two-component system, OmpR family, response regulator RegX3 [Actinomycetota bacterium]
MMPKVLIIEDEVSIGEALEYQLQREGYDVERAVDGFEGLQRFNLGGADLVLLDLMLPGMSGEEICREIRRQSRVPIIMLTAKHAEIDKVVGLELGADDYVTKPFSTRELVARVKAVLRRGTEAADPVGGVLEGGGIRLDPQRHEVVVHGTEVMLPPKEFALLAKLMENAGRVLTRQTLIDDVWGADYYGDTRTLDVHIKRLRAKCEDDPHNPAHLITVRGLGYRFVP